MRRTVARAVGAGLPVPALGSALAYFDSYRQARGTSNLIQAQRDFFGAHGFERIDARGRASRPVGGCLTLALLRRRAGAGADHQGRRPTAR